MRRIRRARRERLMLRKREPECLNRVWRAEKDEAVVAGARNCLNLLFDAPGLQRR